MGTDDVELVFAAPWSEVDSVSDVVESVVICASTDWEVEMDEELVEGLARVVVVDVLFSWRYCRFSATERMAQTRRRAKLRRNMLKKTKCLIPERKRPYRGFKAVTTVWTVFVFGNAVDGR